MIKLIQDANSNHHDSNTALEPSQAEGSLLDAYSKAVIGASEKVSPAVVHIKVQ